MYHAVWCPALHLCSVCCDKIQKMGPLITHRMIVILKINFKINHRIYFLQEESFLQESCSCPYVCQDCPVPFICSVVLCPSIQKVPCLIPNIATDIKTKKSDFHLQLTKYTFLLHGFIFLQMCC